MKTIILTAAVLAVLGSTAHAAEMPKALIGQWCYTQGHQFVKAKTVCKETRQIAFEIIKYGFWIKFANARSRVICAPLEVKSNVPNSDDWEFSWRVTAACGPDNNSGPIHQITFNFDDVATSPNHVVITESR